MHYFEPTFQIYNTEVILNIKEMSAPLYLDIYLSPVSLDSSFPFISIMHQYFPIGNVKETSLYEPFLLLVNSFRFALLLQKNSEKTLVLCVYKCECQWVFGPFGTRLTGVGVLVPISWIGICSLIRRSGGSDPSKEHLWRVRWKITVGRGVSDGSEF
jgi:hypothetical protein